MQEEVISIILDGTRIAAGTSTASYNMIELQKIAEFMDVSMESLVKVSQLEIACPLT